MFKANTHFHFIGIGGIGMSGLALVLTQRGYRVSGCDSDCSQKSVAQLRNHSCVVAQGNNTDICMDDSIDVVIYSTAISHDSAELTRARERGISILHRSALLAELMRSSWSIAVAGSHGKTTTSSLIAHTAVHAQLDPTIVVGGRITSIESNARAGSGRFLIAEADESDRSFVLLFPTVAVITNIDYEHAETYSDLNDVVNSFRDFIARLPLYGKAVVCLDDPAIQSLIPSIHVPVITYGIATDADYTAQDILLHDDYCEFTLVRKHTDAKMQITVPLLGTHNILNTLATCAIADQLSLPWHITQQAIASFKGVDRRFTYKGTFAGASFYDDYGHHPIEIFNTLAVARKKAHQKLIVVFQPHRYSRTEKFWSDFVRVLGSSGIDTLIITDIFPASEMPKPGVTAERLAHELAERNPSLNVCYAAYDTEFTAIKSALLENLMPADTVLLLGAGKMNRLIEHL